MHRVLLSRVVCGRSHTAYINIMGTSERKINVSDKHSSLNPIMPNGGLCCFCFFLVFCLNHQGNNIGLTFWILLTSRDAKMYGLYFYFQGQLQILVIFVMYRSCTLNICQEAQLNGVVKQNSGNLPSTCRKESKKVWKLASISSWGWTK